MPLPTSCHRNRTRHCRLGRRRSILRNTVAATAQRHHRQAAHNGIQNSSHSHPRTSFSMRGRNGWISDTRRWWARIGTRQNWRRMPGIPLPKQIEFICRERESLLAPVDICLVSTSHQSIFNRIKELPGTVKQKSLPTLRIRGIGNLPQASLPSTFPRHVRRPDLRMHSRQSVALMVRCATAAPSLSLCDLLR